MDNESQIVHNFLKILTRSPLGVPPSKQNQTNASKKLISTSSELFPGSLTNTYSTSPKAGSTLPPKQTKDLPRKNSVPKADQAERNMYNSTIGYAKMHESRTVVAGPAMSPYSTRVPKAHHEKRASVENITPKPMTSSGQVTTLQEDLFYMNNVLKDGGTIKGGKSRQNVRKESTPKQSHNHQHYQDVRPSTAKNSSQQNKILGSFFGNTVSSQMGVSSTTPLSKSMMPLKKDGARPNTAGNTSSKATNTSEANLNSKKRSSKNIESPKGWKDSVKKTPGGGGGGGHNGVDSYYQKMNNYMSKQDSYPSSPIFFTPYDNTRSGKQGTKGHGEQQSRGNSPKNGYTGSKATPSSAKNTGSTSINGKTVKGNDLNSSKNHTNLQISIESEEETHSNPLQSFVTKVNRNGMMSMQPPSVKSSYEVTKGQPPRAQSKEKKNRENTKPKTPNSNHSPMGNTDVRSPKGMKSGTPRAASKDSLRIKYYMTKLEQHHREPNDSDYFNQIFRDHFLQSFQAMSYCRTLKPVDPRILLEKKLVLPRRDVHKNKKTVVFDLDETLIHCNESTDVPADVIIPITFPNGDIIEAGINIRPFAIEILKELSKDFEIIVFTASHSCYANVVLDFIDPNDEYIQYRLFRDNCIQTEEGLYVKDLRIISNRDLKDMVIVDNAAYSFGYQVDNGIPIIPFYDNYNDRELKYLYEYLSSLKNVPDVREINKKTFQFKVYQNKTMPQDVISALFGMGRT